MFASQRTADHEETTSSTTLLDVLLFIIYIRYELRVANGELRRIVNQSTVDTALVWTFYVDKLIVAGLQRLLIAEIFHAMSILDLTDTDSSTTVRQLIGTHLSQHACHIAQLVIVLHLRPLVTAVGQVLIVVMPFVVLSVEEVLQVIKTNCIGVELALLSLYVHRSYQEHDADN